MEIYLERIHTHYADAVELEPVFVDLTIRRYETLTGTKAKIIRSDETV